jgi:hypothetical protein
MKLEHWLFLGSLLAWAAFWGVVVWVVYHFISKYW